MGSRAEGKELLQSFRRDSGGTGPVRAVEVVRFWMCLLQPRGLPEMDVGCEGKRRQVCNQGSGLGQL